MTIEKFKVVIGQNTILVSPLFNGTNRLEIKDRRYLHIRSPGNRYDPTILFGCGEILDGRTYEPLPMKDGQSYFYPKKGRFSLSLLVPDIGSDFLVTISGDNLNQPPRQNSNLSLAKPTLG